MVNSVDHIAEQIFKTIKGFGHPIVLYTDDGKKTADPADARRFYAKDIKMMVNFVVDKTTNEIVVNLSNNTDLKEVKPMLSSIRNIANRYIIEYTVKTFGKSIEPRDFAFMAKSKVEESGDFNLSMDDKTKAYRQGIKAEGTNTKNPYKNIPLLSKFWNAGFNGAGYKETFESNKMTKTQPKQIVVKTVPGSRYYLVVKSNTSAAPKGDELSDDDISMIQSGGKVGVQFIEEAQLNELTPKQKAMKQGAITNKTAGPGRGASGPPPTSSAIKKGYGYDASHRRAEKMFSKGPRGTASNFDKGSKIAQASHDAQADFKAANAKVSKPRKGKTMTAKNKKVNEISKDTARDYRQKATDQIGMSSRSARDSHNDADREANAARYNHRPTSVGVHRQTDDEKAAGVKRSKKSREYARNQERKTINRAKGISRASSRLHSESLGEGFSGWHGSARKSINELGDARIIVKHRRSVDEEKRGARTRQIESIFIENAEGERFKFPSTNITAAKAMARHVQEGGAPFDDFGQHIYGIMEELNQLKKFHRKNKRADFFENAMIGEEIGAHIGGLRNSLKSMSSQKGYSKQFESFTTENEDVSKEKLDELKDNVTVSYFDEAIADSLPYVARIIENLRGRQAKEASIVEFARQIMDSADIPLSEACDDEDPEGPSAQTYNDQISEVAAWASYLAPKMQAESLASAIMQVAENVSSVSNQHVNMAMAAINVIKQNGAVSEASDTGEEKDNFGEAEVAQITETFDKYSVRKLFDV